MKTVLFVVNYFNDVDHNAPLMREFSRQGFQVILLCLTKYDLASDPRVQYLESFYNLKILRLKFLPRTSGKSNAESRSLSLPLKLFREAMFNWFFAIFLIKFFSMRYLIFTWGRPRAKGFQRQLFLASKFLAVPVFCLPHGQNIYTNYDPNTQLRANANAGKPWPDFSPRNEFSGYVVQTRRHREMLIAWGMSSTKVASLGSTRFDEGWLTENQKLYPQIDLFPTIDDGKRILFFLPHWRYNVNKDATLELIHHIAEIEGVFLVIKGHTRGDEISQKEDRSLSKRANLLVNTPIDSSPLISWADIVINFGSSIAIEAIARSKIVINPSYLHSNETVFDETPVVETTNALQETIALIAKLTTCAASGDLDHARSDFLKTEVYNDHNQTNVSRLYVEYIMDRKSF